jgi:enoyl-CoA hydratase/carnithine racemase
MTLQQEHSGSVMLLRLAAPPMNPIDTALRNELAAALTAIESNEEIRAVVVWGGLDCFAAGADIAALQQMGYEQIALWNRRLQKTLTALAELRLPTVAAVNGYALGGGLELALACDLRILGAGATVGLPEVKLGIMPGSGGTQRLTRLVGPGRAKELVMTGRLVRAAEARTLGIAEFVVPDAEVRTRALALAHDLARGPRFAVAAIKEAIDAATAPSDGLALERALIAGLFATTDKDRGMESFRTQGPGKAEFT